MTFLNVVEIESALKALASTYPTVTELITLPFFTVEGRQSHAIRIGNKQCYRNGVLIISGAHAREWGGPDICINLASDLLEAWTAGTGLVYGGTAYTAGEIWSIIDGLDVIIFPDINPDGRHYSQTKYGMWRKNRNTASSGGQATRIGVDVNRNYDFLWDFTVAFSSGALAAGTLASNDPSSDLFHGAAPFSEAESRNVRWLFEQFPHISDFVDVHSYGGDILHPWGDDSNQSSTPSMNFTNPAWNGQRGLQGDAYGEFIGICDLGKIQSATNAIKTAIAGVRGQNYTIAQAFFLPGWITYPTSGSSQDWAFSRHFVNQSERKVRAYTFEFNNTHNFFPTWDEMEQIIPDVDAGLVQFCLGAVPKWRIIFFWCWWRKWFYELVWRRVFPWDIWGPYGPWGQIRRIGEAILYPIVAPIISLLDNLFRKR